MSEINTAAKKLQSHFEKFDFSKCDWNSDLRGYYGYSFNDGNETYSDSGYVMCNILKRNNYLLSKAWMEYYQTQAEIISSTHSKITDTFELVNNWANSVITNETDLFEMLKNFYAYSNKIRDVLYDIRAQYVSIINNSHGGR